MPIPCFFTLVLPIGNIYPATPGKATKYSRKRLGVTHKALALTSGTGLRFVIDLEKGKETCQIGKALAILHTLGIRLTLTPPAIPTKEE